MRKYGLVLLLIVMGSCAFGAGMYFGRSKVVVEPVPATGQFATMRILEDYRQTGDPGKRKAIEQASKESEILASRIFRAFGIVSQLHQDSRSSARAEQVLSTNTILSLSILKLLFVERPDPSDVDNTVERDRMRTAYLGWCAGIAEVESDGKARAILEELSQHDDKDIADEASSLLDYLQTSNLNAKSIAYRESRRWEDLQWIQLRCCRKGMDRAGIMNLLGKPDFKKGPLIAYKGERDYSRGNYLWLGFVDAQLLDWEWGQSPDEEGSQRLSELQRILDSR